MRPPHEPRVLARAVAADRRRHQRGAGRAGLHVSVELVRDGPLRGRPVGDLERALPGLRPAVLEQRRDRLERRRADVRHAPAVGARGLHRMHHRDIQALAHEGAVHVRRHGHDETAHERLDARVPDELHRGRGARRGAALVIRDEELDLPPENAPGRVELRDRQLQTEPHLPVVRLNQLVLSLPVPVGDECADAQRPGLEERGQRRRGSGCAQSGAPRRRRRRTALDDQSSSCSLLAPTIHGAWQPAVGTGGPRSGLGRGAVGGRSRHHVRSLAFGLRLRT